MENKIIALIFWILVSIYYFVTSIIYDFDNTFINKLFNYIIIFCQGGIIFTHIKDIFIKRD